MKIEVEDKESNNHSNRLAVILIDVQESLLAGLKNKNELLDALNILIQSTNFFNLPLFVTEQVPNKLGPTAQSLVAELSNIQSIAKSSFSIFGCAEIREKLFNKKISHLILSGIETPICIYLSAIDALKSGLEVTILSDCIGSRRTDDESIVLSKLQHAGCHILPLESFLYGYMGSSEHPNFREISKLIRNR